MQSYKVLIETTLTPVLSLWQIPWCPIWAPGKGGAGITLTGGTAGPSLESAFPNARCLGTEETAFWTWRPPPFHLRRGGCFGLEKGCLEAPTAPKLMS